MSMMRKLKDFINAEDTILEDEYSEYYEDEYDNTAKAEKHVEKHVENPVRKITKTDNDKVLSLHNNQKNELVLVEPKTLSDASAIAKHVKEDKTCIINVIGVDNEMSQRIADFVGGATFALGGNVEMIAEGVFAALPSSVEFNGNMDMTTKKMSSKLSFLGL